MQSEREFNVRVTPELAKLIQAKVESGEYASVNEVFNDGLRALENCDRAVEAWIHEDVAPAYDSMKADPSRALTAETVRQSLEGAFAASNSPMIQ
jgi:putative addiction module CopG family antidote